MNDAKLFKKTRGLSVQGLLILMRDMQIGLAAYASKHKMDDVQMGMLRVISRVEKMARDRFFSDRLQRLAKYEPSALTSEDGIQTHKQLAGEEWRSLYRKYAY